MADIVLKSSDRFPVGTSVAAYPASNWLAAQKPPAGAPVGSAAETRTVANDGTLTFTTLTDGVEYYAYASVSGEHRYVHFFGGQPGNPLIADHSITEADIALANTDGVAGKPSLRTLGTGAQQAAAGNDPRFLADLDASTTVKGISKLSTAPVSATNPIAAGDNDSRLTDARTPTAHKTSHEPGGSDALTALTSASFAAASVDGTAGTASLRTLGTSAAQAAAGNDSRLSDARAPTAHKTLHEPGGSDALTLLDDSSIKAAAGIAKSKLASLDVVNADVNAAAAIAYSKLALAGAVVNADIATTAAIAYSKLALTNSILNADIGAAAAIAYSKLNLATSIVNTDVNASAAIAESKLNLATDAAAGTGSRRTIGKSALQAADGADTEYAFSGWNQFGPWPVLNGVGGATVATTWIQTVSNLIALNASNNAQGAWYFDPADFSGGGTRTTKLRVKAFLVTNGTAPAVNFTLGLYPIATWGGDATGAIIATLGTATTTVAINAPGASSQNHAEGTVVTFPAAGWYALGVVSSGTTAVGSFTRLGVHLQVQQV